MQPVVGGWFRFDDVIVDGAAFRVEKSGRALALEPKSIRLLLYLIENRGRAIGKEELIRQVWEDVAVTDNALSRVVAQLRKALGDDAKVARYIETVPTLGYRFVAEVTTETPPAPVAAPLPPPVKRGRLGPIAAALLLLAIGAAAGIWFERSHAPQVQMWSGTLLGGSFNAFCPRISPDGQLLAFVSLSDPPSQVAVMKPDGQTWTVLTHDRNGSVSSVAWSWDSKRIYYDRNQAPTRIYSIAALGGEPRLLLENAQTPIPLPDGTLVVSRITAGATHQLFHFWPDSGRIEPLLAYLGGFDLASARAFPDGNEIAVWGQYNSPGGPARLFALNVSDGKVRELSESGFHAGFEMGGGADGPAMSIAPGAKWVYLLQRHENTSWLMAFPRDGSRKARYLFSVAAPSPPITSDAAPDGSLFFDHVARQYAVLRFDSAGKSLSEIAVPTPAEDPIELPDGRIIFCVRRTGRSQLMTVAPGSEPQEFLASREPSAFPGALLGEDRIVFVEGEGGGRKLAVATLRDGRVVQHLNINAESITSVAAGPDSASLYYASAGTVWRQSLSGGAPEKIGDGYGVTAGRDGKPLYLLRATASGRELAPAGSDRAFALPTGYPLDPRTLSPGAIGPDGRILVTVGSPDVFFFRTAIFDPAKASLNVVPVQFPGIVGSPAWTRDGQIVANGVRWSSSLWRYRSTPGN
jgi:DNA-binding winged helix-turn-helix (wHTH) protein